MHVASLLLAENNFQLLRLTAPFLPPQLNIELSGFPQHIFCTVIIDMVVAARALAELRLVSVFARIPPTHHHPPPPPTLTELSYFSAPCGLI